MKQENVPEYGVLALMVIAKSKSLNNTAKLITLMERVFSVFDCTSVFSFIRNQGYVEYDLIDGIHYYRLTDKGYEVIAKESRGIKAELLKKHPERVDILNGLFEPVNT